MRTERAVREDLKSLRDLVAELGESPEVRQWGRELRKELARFTADRARRVMVVHSRPTR